MIEGDPFHRRLMKKRFELPATVSEVSFYLTGDIGGNAQEAVIEVSSDGGQFDYARVEKTDTGFRLRIIGVWELGEFLEAMCQLSKLGKQWHVNDIS